jgi:CRP/FNR family transcriptional regulator, cyclic AMP receptor protein
MLQRRLELLQRMPIFGAISDDALHFLLERAQAISVPAGSYFFRESDEASTMYVLESGRVEVIRNWHGRDLFLRELGPGDCFGEMALMDLFPRSASVRALDDCHAIVLDSGDLLDLYQHDVEQFALVQMNMGREVSRRLRATDELLFRAMMGEPPAEHHWAGS